MFGINLGENNGMWKGDNVGLVSLHEWISKRLSKPELCQMCNKVPSHDLANISGEYRRDLTDWQWLCRRCHMLSDGRMNNLKHCPKGAIKIDMSERKCYFCGRNTYFRKDTGRPNWYSVNGKLSCVSCYGKEYRKKRKIVI